ncbi:MAG: urease subunit beta [Chloroflexota bacterium]|nr:urease subunit beta [Chloroflexota bacterium]
MSNPSSHYIPAEEPIEINPGRPTATLLVWNTGDRAIQVGSHFHFFEVNRALRFDREAAYGMRLDIPAGTAVRFEPGDRKEVTLVAIGGTRRILGLNGLTTGSLDSADVRSSALEAMRGGEFARIPSEETGAQGDR